MVHMFIHFCSNGIKNKVVWNVLWFMLQNILKTIPEREKKILKLPNILKKWFEFNLNLKKSIQNDLIQFIIRAEMKIC